MKTITGGKVEEFEQGERCTSYFVNLERQKKINKLMTTLITNNETVIDKQEDSFKRDFYF